MEFRYYQNMSKRYAVYKNPENIPGLAYLAMGLTGEVGETANKIKKLFRDHNGQITEESKQAIIDELGDCLWYLSQITTELGVSLDIIPLQNLAKLRKRKRDNTIQGEGDNR